MAFQESFQKEKYVALNAQPRKFRIVKWIIILLIVAALYWWKGWKADAIFAACSVILGTSLHFLLRWKTKGWTQAWGPYKKPIV